MAFARGKKSKNSERRNGVDRAIPTGESFVPEASGKARFSAELFQQALERLIGTSNITVSLADSGIGTFQELLSQRSSFPWKSDPSSLQTLLFQDESSDPLIVAAPTTTLLFLLDVFLGLDVERLSSDKRLWDNYNDAIGSTSELTELERELLLKEGSRLGVLVPLPFDKDVSRKTLFLEQNLHKGIEYLGEGDIYWEIRTFEASGCSFWLAVLFNAATLPADSESQRQLEVEAIQLPDFEKEDKSVVMTVRIASGTIEESAWESLRPGDVLTTEAPAEQLFDAIVNDKVVFKVRPGLFRGQPAVQIKEKL